MGRVYCVLPALALVAAALPTSKLQPHLSGTQRAPPAAFAAQICGVAGETFTLTAAGALVSVSSGLCATIASYPITNGAGVALQSCTGSSAQRFAYVAANQTLVSALNNGKCLNLANYGTVPGTQAWMWDCSTADCEGNCAWQVTGGSSAGPTFTNATLVNPGSRLCLQDGTALPPLPHTCEAGSPSYNLPFCDPALPVDERVADLLGRMDLPTKVQQFSIPASHFTYNAPLNLKSFLWDLTCMRGIAWGAIDPERNVTVFPHAIALAATWDTGLYTRIGAATALEGRIVNAINYNSSGGTSWQGVNCDGGPLANTAHDPRWGRISETYGEDPFLSAVMGMTATRALQNRSEDRRWLATSQVTRHYLGYHGASDLPNGGNEFIDLYSFTEQQELPYRSFQVQGDAEGLMCAMSAFSIGERSTWNSSLAPMIPSCVHPFLWSKLRTEWASDCYVQSDCCDSVNSMVNEHHFYPDIATAALNAIEMGLQASYGPDGDIDEAVTAMLTNGTLDQGLFDTRIARTLLTRFRLGEFDIGRNPDFPYAGPYDTSILDGPANRALAREATAASIVLLNNAASFLPLKPKLGPGKTLAVIGPFADCTNKDGGYGNHDVDSPLVCSYLHSYSGTTSVVSSVLSAAQEAAQAGGFTVTYAQGSNIVSAQNGGITQAVATAQAADVVLLVVGLGALIEAEGRDRTTLQLPAAQQALVDAIAASSAASKTVLTIVSAGTVDTSYTSFPASVQAWYGGEEAGHGLLDVLMGDVNPSAKLPVTVYKEAYLGLIEPVAVFAMTTPAGVGRTYRFLNESQASGGGPPGSLVHYWFGHGLSYTTFTYSALSVSLVSPAPGPSADDLTTMATVTVTVTNSGPVAGAEVAQVYVSLPTTGPAVVNATGGAPVAKYSLFAFSKTAVLTPGQGVQLSWDVPLRAFQTTGISGRRTVTGGSYTVAVSGHLPDDTAGGAQASNVVTAVVTVQPPSA